MDVFSYSTRVTYGEVDGALHLTLRGAMAMMQEAAIVHSSQAGYAVADIPRTHVIWMLVHWRVKMVKDACWNETVAVKTWPRSMGRVTSVRNFEISNARGETVALGESEWILVNTDTGRAKRITPEIAGAYELVPRDVFSEPFPDAPEGEGEAVCRLDIRRSDMDTNHHVNNLVYLDYALEALPEGFSWDEVAIAYHRQLLPGQRVVCRRLVQGDLVAVDLVGEGDGILHGRVLFRAAGAKAVEVLDSVPESMV